MHRVEVGVRLGMCAPGCFWVLLGGCEVVPVCDRVLLWGRMREVYGPMLQKVCGKALLSFIGGVAHVVVYTYVYISPMKVKGEGLHVLCGMERGRLHSACTSFQVCCLVEIK